MATTDAKLLYQHGTSASNAFHWSYSSINSIVNGRGVLAAWGQRFVLRSSGSLA